MKFLVARVNILLDVRFDLDIDAEICLHFFQHWKGVLYIDVELSTIGAVGKATVRNSSTG